MRSLGALVLALALSPAGFGEGSLELRSGETIAIVGNALAERMLHEGSFEARLQLAHPQSSLTVRNLGFAGDEVVTRQRTSGFGTPDEHMAEVGASVVIAMFGEVESFRGADGTRAFADELARYVRHLRAMRFAADDEGFGRSSTEVVLVAPIPHEDLGDPLLPDAKAANARVALYADAVRAVATQLSAPFVDAGPALRAAYERESEPLTIDGVHLNDRGNAVFAAALAHGLFPDAEEPDDARLQSTRTLVVAKDARWFRRHHVADGYNVYGERSMLEYNDQTNRVVMQRELEVLDAMCANLDRGIWEHVSGLEPSSLSRVPVPTLLPVVTNRPGEGPHGEHVYLSGEDEIARMTAGAGLEVTLFADESRFPDLAKPVQMSFDTRGRLWVAVWPTYPNARPDQAAADKLIVLEDKDGDGRADTCTPFVSDLNNPTGFEFWNGGVFVATAPNLLFLRDIDGDGVADQRERVLEGLGSADTHHASNSFVLGPDGALYFQEGIFHRTQVESVYGVVRQKDGCAWRYEPRTRRFERYAPYGFLNPHGHVFDRWGQDFITDGTGNENYYALPITGRLDSPLQHPTIPTFFAQRSRPAGGTEIISSLHFPPEMQGDYLIANVIGFQGLFRYHLRDDGSGFGADERDPILFSSDPNFRPVDIEIGPDGALYFLDWHNSLIGHMQHHLRDPSRDHVRGRVYRVTARGRALSKPAAIAGRPIPELLELLKSPEDRVRYRTRIELSSRPTPDVVAAARAWVAQLVPKEPEYAHHLLEALWLQEQHQVLDWQLLERVLHAGEPRARAAATRVARNLRRQVPGPLPYFELAIADEHPRVRLEALVALSYVETAAAAETALRALRKPMDPYLDYALEETMRALEPLWRAEVAAGRPFAADDPAAQAWALSRSSTDALLAQEQPTAALFVELLARHGLDTGQYAEAARGLARIHGTRAVDELAAAIARADQQDDGHTDHVIAGLFQTLHALAPDSLPEPIAALRNNGVRDSTCRLATAAAFDTGASFADAWTRAGEDSRARAALLDSLRHVHAPRPIAEAMPQLQKLIEQTPSDADGSLRGRFVRIELPGAERTLTLAEVQVFHGTANIAPGGTVTQSTTNWDGVAARAIDGNTSGVYGDGGQTHTIEARPDPWWELDLGAEHGIDRIVIWNRTDEQFGRRLDGAVICVLDATRESVQTVVLGAAEPRWSADFVPDSVELRRTAARVLGALAGPGARTTPAVEALAKRWDDGAIGAAAADALASIPVDSWPTATADAVTRALSAALAARAGAPVERSWLALADALSARTSVDTALALDLRRARRNAGPKVALIRPVPESLTFDKQLVIVAAGRPIEFVFENVDIMPHNLVVTARGALAKVGIAAEAMSGSPDAWARSFVPDMPEVLHASKLLQPGTTETLAFTAPTELGDYPYVCTFPGHWIRMNGILRVVPSEDGEEESVTAHAAPTRAFVRNWTFDELADDVSSRAMRDANHGRAVFETASCLTCHKLDTEGGTTGPPLREVVARYTAAELLRHVLEPSLLIAPEYVAEIFQTTDGRVVAGRVASQDDTTVRVQVDPYGGAPVELAREDIEDHATSKVSVMPSGLLSTFRREAVLDLIAYLVSLKP
jgi:putative heme-binding domain-containing protein